MLLLQALPYVCLLIAMLFFIYAIIGMQVSTDSSACFLGHREAGETHPQRYNPAQQPACHCFTALGAQEGPKGSKACLGVTSLHALSSLLLPCLYPCGDVGTQLGSMCSSCFPITPSSFHRFSKSYPIPVSLVGRMW